jgi:peptide chain release factor subunit 3
MPYLKKIGFNLAKDLTFMPVSGLTGLGLKEQIDPTVCPWYRYVQSTRLFFELF